MWEDTLIKISDKYSFEPDTYGWKLHTFHTITSKKTGKPVVKKKTEWPSNLLHLCQMVIDKQAKTGKSLADIVNAIERAASDLRVAIGQIPFKTDKNP